MILSHVVRKQVTINALLATEDPMFLWLASYSVCQRNVTRTIAARTFSAPKSPDKNLPDFDSFPELKKELQRKCLASTEIILATVTYLTD
jgi:hypothetical protein